jgi:hypothetical protein
MIQPCAMFWTKDHVQLKPLSNIVDLQYVRNIGSFTKAKDIVSYNVSSKLEKSWQLVQSPFMIDIYL